MLVTPASGSPEVDQGLVKGLKLVSIRCSQAHSQSSNVVKQSKDKKINQLPTSQCLSVKKQTHTRTVQPEELNTTVVSREVEVLLLAQRKRVRF